MDNLIDLDARANRTTVLMSERTLAHLDELKGEIEEWECVQGTMNADSEELSRNDVIMYAVEIALMVIRREIVE